MFVDFFYRPNPEVNLAFAFVFVQYVLPPGSVVYTGCVGDDDLAEQLKAANAREGLDQVYHVNKNEKTGACAVVITGHER